MTTRRGFLAGILAAGAAPAIVKAEILMPIAPKIWTYEELPLQIYNTYTSAANFDQEGFHRLIMDTFMRHKDEIVASVANQNALYRRLDAAKRPL